MALALLNADHMETTSSRFLLTLREGGELLKLHPRTLERMIRRKHLPGVKIGGQWRILKKDLAKLIQDLDEL